MAGYRRQNTIYNLVFPDFDGLEIRIRGLSTGQMMKLWEDTGAASSNKDAEASKATTDMLKMFVSALIEWNLEDEGGMPIPTTMDGIQSLDLPFVLELVEAWTTALAGASKELGKDLPSGKPYPEVQIPMDVS